MCRQRKRSRDQTRRERRKIFASRRFLVEFVIRWTNFGSGWKLRTGLTYHVSERIVRISLDSRLLTSTMIGNRSMTNVTGELISVATGRVLRTRVLISFSSYAHDRHLTITAFKSLGITQTQPIVRRVSNRSGPQW